MSNTHRNRRDARGFSVVELLVAMGLSVLLLAGVATMFASSRRSYETNDHLARIEENGRFALDSIVRDIRASGYVGCSKLADASSTLNGAGTGMWDYALAVQGYEATSATGWGPALDTTIAPSATGDSDVLIVRVPRPGLPALRLRAAMATGKDEVPVSKFPAGEPGAFKDHQILMVSDCDHRSIFEVTKYDAQAGTIEHAVSTATATSPGNASDDLLHVFQKSATTTALQSVVYYVRTGASGGPSLWRGVDGAAPEELAEGVEKLEVRYGVDINGDRVADVYDKASVAAVYTNFADVVSVSIGMLVRSPVPYGPKESHKYVVLDQDAEPDDQYMRRVFVTTAAIRNTAL